jgi:hypothetical protein
MADEDELLDEDEDEELNWPAIIIATIVIIGLIGGLVWYFLIREVPEEELNKEPDYVVPESLLEEAVYVDMPDMIISPHDSKGRFYLIVKFDVVMNDRSAAFNEMIVKPHNWAKALNLVVDVYSDYTREELRIPKVKENARQYILDEWNHIIGWDYDAELEALGQLEPPPLEALYYAKYVIQ